MNRRDLVDRFWAPADLDELRAAGAEAEAADWPDAREAWTWDGDRRARAVVRLPLTRPHPAAAVAWGRARGWAPGVVAAVLAEAAWIDDAGRAVRWPWYREQDAAERPGALAAVDGLALPPRFLDEPHDPAWYFARSGAAALPDLPVVSVLPLPPRARFRPVRHEGGWRGPSALEQQVQRLVHGWVTDEAHLDRVLRAVCAGFGGAAAPEPPSAPAPLARDAWPDGDGRLEGLRTHPEGVEVTSGPRSVVWTADGRADDGPRRPEPAACGVLSACERYALRGAEVVHRADDVVVAELPEAPASRRRLIPAPDRPTTVLGGVSFTVRRAGSAVVPGVAQALVLPAGQPWRWVLDGILGVGRRAVGWLGDDARHAAFTADGGGLWVLTGDALHLLVDEGGWRLLRSWPVAEVRP